MLKFFNRKKKDNKGFTLVELVIVVAILAILVGLLAPQYTKYVEKSRKTADANNLEEIVKEIKVVASDSTYAIPEGTFTVVIKSAKGTDTNKKDTPSASVTFEPATTAGATTGSDWTEGLNALMEGTWTKGTNSLTSTSLTLKSNKWTATEALGSAIVVGDHAIGATVKVDNDGTMTVTYNPATIKEGTY